MVQKETKAILQSVQHIRVRISIILNSSRRGWVANSNQKDKQWYTWTSQQPQYTQLILLYHEWREYWMHQYLLDLSSAVWGAKGLLNSWMGPWIQQPETCIFSLFSTGINLWQPAAYENLTISLNRTMKIIMLKFLYNFFNFNEVFSIKQSTFTFRLDFERIYIYPTHNESHSKISCGVVSCITQYKHEHNEMNIVTSSWSIRYVNKNNNSRLLMWGTLL